MIHTFESGSYVEVWTDIVGDEGSGRCIGTGNTRREALADAITELESELAMAKSLFNASEIRIENPS